MSPERVGNYYFEKLTLDHVCLADFGASLGRFDSLYDLKSRYETQKD